MKITEIEPVLVHRWVYARVHTDEGLTGLGEAHSARKAQAMAAAIKELERPLKGRDPLDLEQNWQYAYRNSFFRGGPQVMGALSAVDIALWDVAGKHYGMPIYRLLGGPCRRKVRVYVDAWGRSPEELAEHASRLVKEGYTALRLGPYTERFPDQFHAKMIDDAVARVKAVREAVGNEVDLCVEVHGRAQPYEAIALGKELEKYRILFYEDPILPENIDAMANVAAHVNVPIATGERLYTLYEFRELLVKNAALMVRPDVCLAGGITQTKKIATLAEAFFVGVIPHNPLSPVSTAACVHIDAAIHNFTIQEYSPEDRPPKSELFQPLRLEKGYLLLPEKPGLGLDLDEKAVEKYPWDVNIYDSAPGAEFREDGSLADS